MVKKVCKAVRKFKEIGDLFGTFGFCVLLIGFLVLMLETVHVTLTIAPDFGWIMGVVFGGECFTVVGIWLADMR